ncbi:hypothetical protein D3C72_1762930 [compost metagenome]
MPAGLDLPDLRLRLVERPALAEASGQAGAGTVFGAQQLAGGRGRHGLDRAPDLAARRGLLVHDQHRQALAAQADGRAHAGGTRADHHDIEFALHGITLRRPNWRSTRIPSRTVTRQVWVDATPSTMARQSKHTPIMQ